jgi:CheY-like chemotaxis protein
MAKQVLIVEDAEEIRSSMAELLASEGYEVDSAANGLEALQKLTSSSTLPGLILLDLMMPEMDGYQFRAEQQRDERLAKIPVLLMTAGGDVQAKARELGVGGHLKKPFTDIDSLLKTIGAFF